MKRIHTTARLGLIKDNARHVLSAEHKNTENAYLSKHLVYAPDLEAEETEHVEDYLNVPI